MNCTDEELNREQNHATALAKNSLDFGDNLISLPKSQKQVHWLQNKRRAYLRKRRTSRESQILSSFSSDKDRRTDSRIRRKTQRSLAGHRTQDLEFTKLWELLEHFHSKRKRVSNNLSNSLDMQSSVEVWLHLQCSASLARPYSLPAWADKRLCSAMDVFTVPRYFPTKDFQTNNFLAKFFFWPVSSAWLSCTSGDHSDSL